MAKCDQGYLCDVCAEPVENITESDLYLRYVIGEVPYEQLMAAPERHIECNPVNAQFIVAEAFSPPEVTGPFSKQNLDADYVEQRETLLTRGWNRLQELAGQNLHLAEYPLPEFRFDA